MTTLSPAMVRSPTMIWPSLARPAAVKMLEKLKLGSMSRHNAARGAYWFIEAKKSSLDLASFILSSRNCIASTVPICIRIRRSTHILDSFALVDQQLFLAGAGLADVERREDALVGDLAVEHDFASCRCP